ncbi:unnamed protein product [Penicillium salamii]|uniref:Zn(2)-C6 fungal-type domain-containing protein n=1 Tax=Penicillium salamii TaxID=1612424 RepID=A0A9W4J4X8_9EURO|nr:unnamed protein product [Penicillium salamii]CAG8033111.1 unnamed protein product [Penicillium salamii]CAG8058427.1 unnamed protein product [Penicillium salamii]CAG8265467.1 unnamed protein product [Penicillium salamii]CAG8335510.1 unnamed protein product [Penicillium salamii]
MFPGLLQSADYQDFIQHLASPYDLRRRAALHLDSFNSWHDNDEDDKDASLNSCSVKRRRSLQSSADASPSKIHKVNHNPVLNAGPNEGSRLGTSDDTKSDDCLLPSTDLSSAPRKQKRGCVACHDLDLDCSFATDPDQSSYPCETCAFDGMECVPTPEPKWKRSCEGCKTRNGVFCSYKYADYDHSQPCQPCVNVGFPCVAGPAKRPPFISQETESVSSANPSSPCDDEDDYGDYDANEEFAWLPSDSAPDVDDKESLPDYEDCGDYTPSVIAIQAVCSKGPSFNCDESDSYHPSAIATQAVDDEESLPDYEYYDRHTPSVTATQAVNDEEPLADYEDYDGYTPSAIAAQAVNDEEPLADYEDYGYHTPSVTATQAVDDEESFVDYEDRGDYTPSVIAIQAVCSKGPSFDCHESDSYHPSAIATQAVDDEESLPDYEYYAYHTPSVTATQAVNDEEPLADYEDYDDYTPSAIAAQAVYSGLPSLNCEKSRDYTPSVIEAHAMGNEQSYDDYGDGYNGDFDGDYDDYYEHDQHTHPADPVQRAKDEQSLSDGADYGDYTPSVVAVHDVGSDGLGLFLDLSDDAASPPESSQTKCIEVIEISDSDSDNNTVKPGVIDVIEISDTDSNHGTVGSPGLDNTEPVDFLEYSDSESDNQGDIKGQLKDIIEISDDDLEGEIAGDGSPYESDQQPDYEFVYDTDSEDDGFDDNLP